MNTTARAIAIDDIVARKKGVLHVTLRGVGMVALVVVLLLSAFSVVYMKDLNRRLFIQYQTLQQDKAEQLVQWGKLLLEQSTLSTQSRIQQIATKQLDMLSPNAHNIALVDHMGSN